MPVIEAIENHLRPDFVTKDYDIPDFFKYQNGEKLFLQKLEVDGIEFTVNAYPNGNKEVN